MNQISCRNEPNALKLFVKKREEGPPPAGDKNKIKMVLLLPVGGVGFFVSRIIFGTLPAAAAAAGREKMIDDRKRRVLVLGIGVAWRADGVLEIKW
jgi:hypothetical protein